MTVIPQIMMDVVKPANQRLVETTSSKLEKHVMTVILLQAMDVIHYVKLRPVAIIL